MALRGRTVEEMIRDPPPFPWFAVLIGGILVTFIGLFGARAEQMAWHVGPNAPIMNLFYGTIALGLAMVAASISVVLLSHRWGPQGPE